MVISGIRNSIPTSACLVSGLSQSLLHLLLLVYGRYVEPGSNLSFSATFCQQTGLNHYLKNVEWSLKLELYLKYWKTTVINGAVALQYIIFYSH